MVEGNRPYLFPPSFIQSGHGIGDYLGPLFRFFKPMLFRGAKAGAKALGRAALQTGSHILSDIADNPAGYKEIISKHLQETLPAKMAGGGRRKRRRTPSRTRQPPAKRRKRALSTRRKRKPPTRKRKRGGGTKRRPPIKRDIFA